MFPACRVAAKVNLTLEVTARRPDGFHDIVSLIAPLGITDRVAVEPSDTSDTIDVVVEGAAIEGPNLAAVAACALRDRYAPGAGALIRIGKGIPLAAGLGGGSADAAVVLVLLNRLWGLGLAPAELAALGAEVGSDVPFFVHGRAAVVTGHGEHVCPLDVPVRGWCVVILHPALVPEKTARAYGALDPAWFTGGEQTEAMIDRIRKRETVVRGFNVFDRIVASEYPAVDEAWQRLRGDGIEPMLAGAGPSSLVLADDESRARAIEERVRGLLRASRILVAPLLDEALQWIEGDAK